MRRSSFLLPFALLWASCGPITEPRSATELSASISDGAHSGNVHFYWLPPLVPATNPTGVFDGSLSPVVTISEGIGGATIAEFTMATGAGSELVRMDPAAEQYIVNWHTDQFNLNAQVTYRIRVRVGGTELGHADVAVAANGRELKNVDTQQFVGLVDGRTLPIKFRIEKGATDINDAPTLDLIADPAPIPQGAGLQALDLSGITAGPGESQTLTVTATSSNPALVPHPTVNYTSPNATGSLQYAPVASQSGSAVITVTVEDDGGTANGGVNTISRTFTIVVTPVVVTTVSWINPNGGDWSTPSNWSTGVLPTADQDVIIDIAVTSPITHSAGTTEIKTLTSTQPFTLSGGTLTTAGTLHVDNIVSLTGGSLTTGGSITLNVPVGNLTISSVINAGTNALTFNVSVGSITQAGGSVTSGTTILSAGTGITLTSLTSGGNATITTNGGNIAINGPVSSGSADISLSANGGRITTSGGSVTANDLIASASGGISLTNVSIDTFRGTNASGAVSVVDASPNLNIVATGLSSGGNVTITTPGTLTLTGTVTATGSTANVTSGTVTQAGGTVNATSLVLNTATGATLINLGITNLFAANSMVGTLSLSTTGAVSVGAVSNDGGAIRVTSPGNMTVSGNVTSASDVALTSTDASIGQTGGTVMADRLFLNAANGINLISTSANTLGATNTTTGAISITEVGGLFLTSVVNAGGAISISTGGGGNLIVAGTVNSGANATSLTASGGGAIAQAGGMVTAGTLTLNGANGFSLTNVAATRLTAVNAGVGAVSIIDEGGLTLDAVINTGGAISISTGGDLIVNGNVTSGGNSTVLTASTGGSIDQTGGTVTGLTLVLSAASGINLTNTDLGSLEATNTGSGPVSIADIGSLTIIGAGISTATGNVSLTVNGNLTNDATLRLGSAGHVTVGGDFVNTANGVLDLDIRGTALTEFSRFTVAGVATLGGTLNAALVNGFVPASGDRFQFMTFGSHTGFFSTSNLPPSFTLDQSDPTDLEFVVT